MVLVTRMRSIASLNLTNARTNPRAQTRDWSVPDPLTDDDVNNPVVEGPLRRFDCSQITDGGAGVVLVTDDWLRAHPGARPLGRIAGWGHRPVGLGLDREAPEYRGRERLVERPDLVRIVGLDPESLVWLHHQHFWPDPLEAHERGGADLPAVEPDVVRANPRGERPDIEQVAVEPRHLHPERAVVAVRPAVRRGGAAAFVQPPITHSSTNEVQL